MSVSEAECEAYAKLIGYNAFGAWNRGTGMVKGCHKDGNGAIKYNTNTQSTVSCSVGSGICIQKTPYETKTSGQPDSALALTSAECEAYHTGLVQQHGAFNPHVAPNRPKGCWAFISSDSSYTYFNYYFY